MKKVFMTLAAVLMGMTAANAQVILGGNVAIGGSVGSTQTRDGVTTYKASDNFNLQIAPKVGYEFMDGKMEVGASIDLNYGQEIGFGEAKVYYDKSHMYFDASDLVLKDNKKNPIKSGKIETLGLSFTPYIRYFFLQKGIFSLGIQGHVSLGGSFYLAPTMYARKGYVESYDYIDNKYVYIEYEDDKKEIEENNKEMRKYLDNQKKSSFNYGVYLMPVMKFNLSEHCYMDIVLSAIGLYASGSVTNYNKEGKTENVFDVKMQESYFQGGFTGFKGNAISVGFAYKF